VAPLVGRAAIVEVVTKSHTDMAAAIDDRFDQLFGLVQGMYAHRGVLFGPPPMGPMVVPPLGTGVSLSLLAASGDRRGAG
jgi:hypothetical protein